MQARLRQAGRANSRTVQPRATTAARSAHPSNRPEAGSQRDTVDSAADMFRACQVFAHRLLTFSRCQCCPIPAPLDPPGASIMTPCVRAAAVYALSHVAKVASLASFAGCALDADIANQTLRQRLRLPRHHLSVLHPPAISAPPPTNSPASHLLSPPSRPRAQASSTLNRTQLHRRFLPDQTFRKRNC